MPLLHTHDIIHEINKPLLHIQVIGSYYQMTTMDEIINRMKLAHLLSIFSLNLRAPFVDLHLLQIC
jgi:hypothetical protein